ncbi:hypothetical protein ScPMuIL_017869 [Solemya velum]
MIWSQDKSPVYHIDDDISLNITSTLWNRRKYLEQNFTCILMTSFIANIRSQRKTFPKPFHCVDVSIVKMQSTLDGDKDKKDEAIEPILNTKAIARKQKQVVDIRGLNYQRGSVVQLKLKEASVILDKLSNHTINSCISHTKKGSSKKSSSDTNAPPLILKPKTISRIPSKPSHGGNLSSNQRSRSSCSDNNSGINKHPYARVQPQSRSLTASPIQSLKPCRSDFSPASFTIAGTPVTLQNCFTDHEGDIPKQKHSFVPTSIFSINSMNNTENQEDGNTKYSKKIVTKPHTGYEASLGNRLGINLCSEIDISKTAHVPNKLTTALHVLRKSHACQNHDRKSVDITKEVPLKLNVNCISRNRNEFMPQNLGSTSFRNEKERTDSVLESSGYSTNGNTQLYNRISTKNKDEWSVPPSKDIAKNDLRIDTTNEADRKVQYIPKSQTSKNKPGDDCSTCFYCQLNRLSRVENQIPMLGAAYKDGKYPLPVLSQPISDVKTELRSVPSLEKHTLTSSPETPVDRESQKHVYPSHVFLVQKSTKSAPVNPDRPVSFGFYPLTQEQADKQHKTSSFPYTMPKLTNFLYDAKTSRLKVQSKTSTSNILPKTPSQKFGLSNSFRKHQTSNNNVAKKPYIVTNADCDSRKAAPQKETKTLVAKNPNKLYGKEHAGIERSDGKPMIDGKTSTDHSYISELVLPPVSLNKSGEKVFEGELSQTSLGEKQNASTFSERDRKPISNGYENSHVINHSLDPQPKKKTLLSKTTALRYRIPKRFTKISKKQQRFTRFLNLVPKIKTLDDVTNISKLFPEAAHRKKQPLKKCSTMETLPHEEHSGKFVASSVQILTDENETCSLKPGFYIILTTGPKTYPSDNEWFVTIILSHYLPDVNSLPHQTNAVAIGSFYNCDDITISQLGQTDGPELECLESLMSTILPEGSLKDVRATDAKYVCDTDYKPKTMTTFSNNERFLNSLISDCTTEHVSPNRYANRLRYSRYIPSDSAENKSRIKVRNCNHKSSFFSKTDNEQNFPRSKSSIVRIKRKEKFCILTEKLFLIK